MLRKNALFDFPPDYIIRYRCENLKISTCFLDVQFKLAKLFNRLNSECLGYEIH